MLQFLNRFWIKKRSEKSLSYFQVEAWSWKPLRYLFGKPRCDVSTHCNPVQTSTCSLLSAKILTCGGVVPDSKLNERLLFGINPNLLHYWECCVNLVLVLEPLLDWETIWEVLELFSNWSVELKTSVAPLWKAGVVVVIWAKLPRFVSLLESCTYLSDVQRVTGTLKNVSRPLPQWRKNRGTKFRRNMVTVFACSSFNLRADHPNARYSNLNWADFYTSLSGEITDGPKFTASIPNCLHFYFFKNSPVFKVSNGGRAHHRTEFFLGSTCYQSPARLLSRYSMLEGHEMLWGCVVCGWKCINVCVCVWVQLVIRLAPYRRATVPISLAKVNIAILNFFVLVTDNVHRIGIGRCIFLENCAWVSNANFLVAIKLAWYCTFCSIF